MTDSNLEYHKLSFEAFCDGEKNLLITFLFYGLIKLAKVLIHAIPAFAGMTDWEYVKAFIWISAFAGMTDWEYVKALFWIPVPTFVRRDPLFAGMTD